MGLWVMMGLDQLYSQLRVDDFLVASNEMVQQFPQEMALGNGIIIGALGLSCVGLLLLTMLKRTARPLVALSFSVIGLILLALAQGLVAPLAEGALNMTLALFAAAGILFLTATIRAARDDVLMGVVLIVALIASIVLGAGAFLGFDDFGLYTRMVVLTVGLMAPVIALMSGFKGDRLALILFGGLLLLVGSFISARLAMMAGMGHWVGALLPSAMFSVGLIWSGWIGSLMPVAISRTEDAPRDLDAVALSPSFEAEPAAEEVPEQVNAQAKEAAKPQVTLEDIDNEAGREKKVSKGFQLAKNTKTKKDKTKKDRRDDEETSEPLFTHQGPERRKASTDGKPERKNKADEAPDLRATSSALWGRSAAAAPVVLEESVPEIAEALKAPANEYWDWAVTGRNQISNGFAERLGIGREDLSPEMLRSMVAQQSLEIFDEEILGGSEPKQGDFDFAMDMVDGSKLKIAGRRFVDEDGLVSRLVLLVVPDKENKKEKGGRRKSDSVDASAKARAANLKAALERGEIRAHFQPIVSVSDGEIAGYEALARWHRPGMRDPLPATAFIGDAIDAGLGLAVAKTIIDEAAVELAAWLKEQPDQGHFVTVNVSADDMLNNEFVKIVKQAIKQNSLPKGALVVELTESHVLENIGKANQVIKALKNAGADVALDDFGAGHSSLSRLSKLNVDMLKTDRALLEELGTSKDASIVLQGAIDIAHRLGLKVIAEGAETEALARTLKSLGCDYGQGYFFGGAEPAGEPPQEETAEKEKSPLAVNLR